MRKLVTLRKIENISPIEGADLIECARVDDWELVIKRGEFKVGDIALYFEIDSFLPEGNPHWQFLIDKSVRTYEGVRGHKLRTVKLRKQVSQGLLLNPNLFENVIQKIREIKEAGEDIFEFDFAEILGVSKYEEPEPAAVLAGQAKGLFPKFIPKTDSERIQNLGRKVFDWEVHKKILDKMDIKTIIPKEGSLIVLNFNDGCSVETLFDSSKIDLSRVDSWNPLYIHQPESSPNDEYEVSIKLDGSSITVFVNDNEVGICSRNLQLKINEENKDNQFIKTSTDIGLIQAMEKWFNEKQINIALQGELMGPGIQKNRENLKEFKIFVYNFYNINEQRYFTPTERKEIFDWFKVECPNLNHVPILFARTKLKDIGLIDVKSVLEFVEGPSINNPVREGCVFKRISDNFNFKGISNKYLLSLKD